jgi:hypothetical protein
MLEQAWHQMLEQAWHQTKRQVSMQLEPAHHHQRDSRKMSLLLVVLVLSFQKLELLVQYPVCYRKLEQTTPVLACFQTWVRQVPRKKRHLLQKEAHYSHRLQT